MNRNGTFFYFPIPNKDITANVCVIERNYIPLQRNMIKYFYS